MNSVIKKLEDRALRTDLPNFAWVIRFVYKSKSAKERRNAFSPSRRCDRINRGGNRATFTVRKVSYGVGVERIFPVHSQRLERFRC